MYALAKNQIHRSTQQELVRIKFIMLPNSLLQRLASWCPWLLRDEPKQPVKVLVTGAAGTL